MDRKPNVLSGKTCFFPDTTNEVLPGSAFPKIFQVFLPIKIQWPVVFSLKNFISAGRLHGKSLPTPITRLVDAAAIKEIIIIELS